MGFSIWALFPLRLRLWLGKFLFRSLDSSAVRVSWHRVIKGPCDPPEIEAMQYVAMHTTIPVPKIHAIHTDADGFIYIEMAYIPGQDLDRAWSGLTRDQRDAIVADLKQHISCLRELQPPTEDTVSSAFQNPAYDGRIGARFFGPMNQNEFHSLARCHLRSEDIALLGDELAKVHTSHYRTCFTHADLAPRNIIVNGGRVAAIIDWAYAGWYPEYWEFTKAHYTSFRDEDWDECLRLALPCYEMELTAERTLWRRLPEPGTTTSFKRDGVWYTRPGSSPSAAWLDGRAGRKLSDLWSLALYRDSLGLEGM